MFDHKFNTKPIAEVYKDAEKKLLLLYLIDKMEIPLTNTQISDFTLEEEFMDYFVLQQSLAEMVDAGYLDEIMSNNLTRYSMTDEGLTTLEYFEKQIPLAARLSINKLVIENREIVRKEYEITANYFYENTTNEFIVKCGIYEAETMLMEVNFAVVTKGIAQEIVKNWKGNVTKIYGKIVESLVTPPPEKDPSAKDEPEEPLDLKRY